VPIFLFGDLGIENRLILAYVFALFLSDLLLDISVFCFLCAVEDIKANGMPFALNLGENPILALTLRFDTYIVLRHAFEHICTLSYVNDLIINLDAVYSRALVFF
jgi:hypothetical protein